MENDFISTFLCWDGICVCKWNQVLMDGEHTSKLPGQMVRDLRWKGVE